MYPDCHYERFSLTDVAKFERRLTKFCKEAYIPGRSMLIFDKSSLLVEGQRTIEVIENQELHKVVLPNITLTYTCIAGTNMCVMYKIWENKTLSVMYNIPQKWDGTELWFCD